MTKKARLIALFLLGLGLKGQSQMMYVKEKSGTKSIFTINDIRKLTFSDGNMIVYCLDDNPEMFALTDIRYVNFTELPTDINTYEKQKPSGLILFPNPVKDVLIITYLSFSETLQVEIMSLDGKSVYQQTMNNLSGLSQANINVSSLSKGVYLCRLINGKTVLTSMFIKY